MKKSDDEKKGEDELILSGGCSKLESVGLFARSLDVGQNPRRGDVEGICCWQLRNKRERRSC